MRQVWRDPVFLRKYLEQYAVAQVFDPLIASNWYYRPWKHVAVSKLTD